MMLALAAIVAAGIVLPHVLVLRRAPPVAAIFLWLSSLALRALACAFVVVYLMFFAPRTNAFDVLMHSCWHAVILVVSGEDGLEGHSVGDDLALLLPAFALAVSLLSVGVRTAQTGRAARVLVERHALGEGPRGSVIVGGPEVAFAVAGVAHPRVVVSAGALASLDDDELAAALDHEQAHIAHRHRFVMLLAIVLRATGGILPGAGRALQELAFHLERDADTWALRHRHDGLALASVICKAAAAERSLEDAAGAHVGESGVRQRVVQLLEDESRRRGRPVAAALNGLPPGCEH